MNSVDRTPTDISLFLMDAQPKIVQFKKSCLKFALNLSFIMRGSRSTAKLPMEYRVNASLPFVKKFSLLRVAVLYF